jgi:hypothetical protein
MPLIARTRSGSSSPAAAVCSFLLVQPDVILPPWAKVIVGAVIVALAVINPQSVSDRTG